MKIKSNKYSKFNIFAGQRTIHESPTALNEKNKNKNRYSAIIPTDEYRIRLKNHIG